LMQQLLLGITFLSMLDVNVISPRSGDTLIFDATTATWYNVSVNARKADFIEQIDGVRTQFTLSIDAVSANDLLISLGGVIQEPGVAFDFTAPRTINFSEPPPFEIPYFILVESIPLTADESNPSQVLPTGTAADEYLQWNNNLKRWVPSTVIQGGTF